MNVVILSFVIPSVAMLSVAVPPRLTSKAEKPCQRKHSSLFIMSITYEEKSLIILTQDNDETFTGVYLCIAMEACEQSLHTKITTLSEEYLSIENHLPMVANFMAEIANGVAACHNQGT
jgi:hypothetical protein